MKKTRFDNDSEDELNQARFFVERGAEVADFEEPGDEGPMFEEEDISATKSQYREQPTVPGMERKTAADDSPFFAHGFGSGDDEGIRRTPAPTEDGDRESLGG